MPKTNWYKYRGLVVAIAVTFLLFSVFRLHHSTPMLPIRGNASQRGDTVRIAKASMLYGPQNEIYEGALETHTRHNEMFGYEMHVLRQGITDGYWNKFAHLFALVVQELSKPEDQRMQWIMYFDANNIFLNPLMPLSIFLPPPDTQFAHVNFLAAKHGDYLSTSTFFLRVCPWSVKLLVKVMALPMIESGHDVGMAMDRATLAKVLEGEGFLSNVLYQPNSWYNALKSVTGTSEASPGQLLVQFPASLEGARWKSMNDILIELAINPKKWAKKPEDTSYPEEIQEYWARIREARHRLLEAELEAEAMGAEASEELGRAIKHMKDTISSATGDAAIMGLAIDRLRNATGGRSDK